MLQLVCVPLLGHRVLLRLACRYYGVMPVGSCYGMSLLGHSVWSICSFFCFWQESPIYRNIEQGNFKDLAERAMAPKTRVHQHVSGACLEHAMV